MKALANRIIILGASGQVGRALSQLSHLYFPDDLVIALVRNEADLAHPTKVVQLLSEIITQGPVKAVINGAAYTQVDRAEQEEELATIINGQAPGEIAQWCEANKVAFVHYSTDYVFPGTGTRGWCEHDPVSPLNAYGRSKLRGEQEIARTKGHWLIFRTSWVYDAFGKNFFNTMLKLGMERESLRVVSDQWGAPTYAPHLAEATLKALKKSLEMHTSSKTANQPFPSGIYHLCGEGVTNWHEFAMEIFKEESSHPSSVQRLPLKVSQVTPISSEEYPTPARRPKNSRLNMDKIKTVFGVSLPDWKNGLHECVIEKCNT